MLSFNLTHNKPSLLTYHHAAALTAAIVFKCDPLFLPAAGMLVPPPPHYSPNFTDSSALATSWPQSHRPPPSVAGPRGLYHTAAVAHAQEPTPLDRKITS